MGTRTLTSYHCSKCLVPLCRDGTGMNSEGDIGRYCFTEFHSCEHNPVKKIALPDNVQLGVPECIQTESI